MTRIFLLYTGGTIGMVANGKSTLSPQILPRVLRYVSDWQLTWSKKYLNEFVGVDGSATLRVEENTLEVTLASTRDIIDSANMNVSGWRIMAKTIYDMYDSYDGFVILHGTDTMAYSASALSFMLHNLGKPVVFTGAQKPLDQKGSDGQANLINALRVAASGVLMSQGINEVTLVFGSVVLRGCRAHKHSTTSCDAFVSPNYPVLAHSNGTNVQTDILHVANGICSFHDIDSDVDVLWLHPGFDICSALLRSPARAVIFCSYGNGHLPDDPQTVQVIQHACDNGRILINISQCQHRTHNERCYRVAKAYQSSGLLSAGDMTMEATICKVMWMLENIDSNAIAHTVKQNICGEITLF